MTLPVLYLFEYIFIEFTYLLTLIYCTSIYAFMCFNKSLHLVPYRLYVCMNSVTASSHSVILCYFVYLCTAGCDCVVFYTLSSSCAMAIFDLSVKITVENRLAIRQLPSF